MAAALNAPYSTCRVESRPISPPSAWHDGAGRRQPLLDIFELVYSTRGAAYGAGDADVHAQLPALWVMTATALLTALLIVEPCSPAVSDRSFLASTLWLGSSVLVGLVYPNLIEGFEVKPNQLEKERPYIANNIASTRQAYGLERVKEEFFPAEDSVRRRNPGQPTDDQQYPALGPPTAPRHPEPDPERPRLLRIRRRRVDRYQVEAPIAR